MKRQIFNLKQKIREVKNKSFKRKEQLKNKIERANLLSQQSLLFKIKENSSDSKFERVKPNLI